MKILYYILYIYVCIYIKKNWANVMVFQPEEYAVEAKFFTECRLLNREVDLIVGGIGDKFNTFFGTVEHPAGIHYLYIYIIYTYIIYIKLSNLPKLKIYSPYILVHIIYIWQIYLLKS